MELSNRQILANASRWCIFLFLEDKPEAICCLFQFQKGTIIDYFSESELKDACIILQECIHQLSYPQSTIDSLLGSIWWIQLKMQQDFFEIHKDQLLLQDASMTKVLLEKLQFFWEKLLNAPVSTSSRN